MGRLERGLGTEQETQLWSDGDTNTGQPLPEIQRSPMGTRVRLIEK